MATFGSEPVFFTEKCRATEEQFQQFAAGAAAVFRQWTALGLVNLYCDHRAAETLLEYVLQWFLQNGEVYSDELELYFEDFFAASRSVIVEDDSMHEVGDILHDLYCSCCRGDYSKVQQYIAQQAVHAQLNTLGQCLNQTTEEEVPEVDGEEGGGNEEVNEEVEQQQPVKSAKKRKSNSKNIGGGWQQVC